MAGKLKVDHGFDTASAKNLQARLKPLIRKTQPYKKNIAHRGIWVEPELLAEIEYRAKSAEGKVRHPFFKAFGRTYELGQGLALANCHRHRRPRGARRSLFFYPKFRVWL